jgi:hypothetical protein
MARGGVERRGGAGPHLGRRIVVGNLRLAHAHVSGGALGALRRSRAPARREEQACELLSGAAGSQRRDATISKLSMLLKTAL